MMKTKQLLIGLTFVMSITFVQAQNEFCPGNIFDNGDLEIGTPTPIHQDINLAQGFSAIWPSGSLADFYTATNSGVGVLPSPPTGNYVSFWISNTNGGPTYREGMYNTFLTPLAANTGSYTFTFDVACLRGNPQRKAEIGIYGINNPTSTLGVQPTSMTTPDNLNLFPGNTILLGTILISGECSNVKQSHSITINTNGMSLPNITNIMITKSDTLIDWSDGGGRFYMGFDNFCLTVGPESNQGAYCCEGENLVDNGNFESGNTGFASDYTQSTLTYPGEYDVTTTAANFNATVSDHSFCEDPTEYADNNQFMVVNGKTQQPAGTTSVVWQQTISVEPEKEYKFCANFKNMPQCTFSIIPEVQIEINGQLFGWNTINTDETDPCDWQKISECFTGEDEQVEIKIHIKECGNGDGNDLAIDDISVQEKLDQNLNITVQHQADPKQITASINTISTADDTILVGNECEKQNGGNQYYWFVYELASYPFNGPIDNVVPGSFAWSSNLMGYNAQVPGPIIAPNLWGLTTNFPTYKFEDDKFYIIGMYVPSCCESCYDEAWTYQLTYNSGRQSSSGYVLTKEDKEYLKSMFRQFGQPAETNDDLGTKATQIYPNPANDMITITTKEAITSYQIRDVLGKVLKSSSFDKTQIDVSKLQSNIYFITFETKNGKKETFKFIKE